MGLAHKEQRLKQTKVEDGPEMTKVYINLQHVIKLAFKIVGAKGTFSKMKVGIKLNNIWVHNLTSLQE